MIRNIILNIVAIFVSLLTIVYMYISYGFDTLIRGMRKFLKYFPLTFVLLIGCSDITSSECDDSCNPDLYCELPVVNGVYQLEYDEDYAQTFAPIYLSTGSNAIRKIAFASDIIVNVQGQWFDLVNTSSYTREDGTTQTTLGVFQQNVGEIINIYCGFYDECDIHYTDHIQVEVVDNE